MEDLKGFDSNTAEVFLIGTSVLAIVYGIINTIIVKKVDLNEFRPISLSHD